MACLNCPSCHGELNPGHLCTGLLSYLCSYLPLFASLLPSPPSPCLTPALIPSLSASPLPYPLLPASPLPLPYSHPSLDPPVSWALFFT